jgi:hypothetical protein
MYKALGGGWGMREGKDFVPEEIMEEMKNRTDWGNLLSPAKMEIPPEERDRAWHQPDW